MTARDYERTPFGWKLIRHAMRDRARRETGSPDSRMSPMFDDWTEGIHEWVRPQSAALVEERPHPTARLRCGRELVDGVRVQSLHAVPRVRRAGA